MGDGLMRLQDWPERMDAFLRAAQARPFAWGRWDCCLFALAHADTITGSRHFDHFKGLCHDQDSARAALDGLGGLEAALDGLFGPRLENTNFAQRGDIVTYDSGNGPALGIVDFCGRKIAVLTQHDGLGRLPRRRALAAWPV